MTDDPPAVQIVPADSAMTQLLAALHGACFDEAWDETAIWQLLSMPGATSFIISPVPGEPAGFVMANHAADQADILAIGILPAERRHALGGKLLRHLAADFRSRGVREIFLEVAADNKAAIGLYKSCGYIEVGARKNYYGADRPNRTAIQMKCQLGG